MMFELITVLFVGLCLGSFLNVIGHRIITEESLLGRSRCPRCNKTIAWYDNIPILSYIFLRGRCRFCQAPISLLYPFIELLTALSAVGLWLTVRTPLLLRGSGFTGAYAFTIPFGVDELIILGVYGIFFAALIISVRTDLEALVISQLCSLWLVPVGWAVAFLPQTLVSPRESFLGSLLGYFSLWLIAFVFTKLTGKEGLGRGDMELLAMIGAFIGPFGVWLSVMIGSIAGLIVGGVYLLIEGKGFGAKIPFGPFLALGAALYFFFRYPLLSLLVG